jgi:hypothetical protein
MPEKPRVIVTNTTLLVTLTAATGSLDVFCTLYDRLVIAYEVEQEVLAGEHDTLFQPDATLGNSGRRGGRVTRAWGDCACFC